MGASWRYVSFEAVAIPILLALVYNFEMLNISFLSR